MLVVGVQDEQQIKCLGRDFVDLVLLRRNGEQHAQEILGVVEVVAWIDERLAGGELVCRGGNRGQLGDDPVGEYLASLRTVYVHRVMVIGRHRTDDG